MSDTTPSKQPIINCHTHIFTGDHVPPYLAKQFIPWPLYYMVSVPFILRVFRFWYKYPYRFQFQGWYKILSRTLYRVKVFLRRNWILNILQTVLGVWITIQVLYVIIDWISKVSAPESSVIYGWVVQIRDWLESIHLVISVQNLGMKILLILILVLFIPWGRNLVFFVLRQLWNFFGLLPDKKSKEFIRRYILLGRFVFYGDQSGIFSRLKNQYPAGSQFVVLPMDMEYMGGGPLKQTNLYREQMKQLAELKTSENQKTIHPFVFIDPRRMKAENDFFQYQHDEGAVTLKSCFLKTYMEDLEFSGFKIYPALGYYPFDEILLPLWKYAADRGIPILTHCIRGTIFYRGKKKPAWDEHPIFQQAKGHGQYEPLLLPERKNINFSVNFTHPLNYLCLLNEELLRQVVAQAKQTETKELFGYTDLNTPLEYDLSHLKLCFGHFGGEDQWQDFLESDRDRYSSRLIREPGKGIDFLYSPEGEPRPGKIEQIWKSVDWYSIICSMILQFEHVYGDISYILHQPDIYPLLKQALQKQNPILRQRVLFGTDFYVVRNHKSEKQLLAELQANLDQEEFDLIARENPNRFLTRKSR